MIVPFLEEINLYLPLRMRDLAQQFPHKRLPTHADMAMNLPGGQHNVFGSKCAGRSTHVLIDRLINEQSRPTGRPASTEIGELRRWRAPFANILDRPSGEPPDHAFLSGTFAPFFRASERPMAIACSRLLTVPPLPPLPDFKVPFFSLRIALATLLLAALPYLRPPDVFPERFVAAIGFASWFVSRESIRKGCSAYLFAATSSASKHLKWLRSGMAG